MSFAEPEDHVHCAQRRRTSRPQCRQAGIHPSIHPSKHGKHPRTPTPQNSGSRLPHTSAAAETAALGDEVQTQATRATHAGTDTMVTCGSSGSSSHPHPQTARSTATQAAPHSRQHKQPSPLSVDRLQWHHHETLPGRRAPHGEPPPPRPLRLSPASTRSRQVPPAPHRRRSGTCSPRHRAHAPAKSPGKFRQHNGSHHTNITLLH